MNSVLVQVLGAVAYGEWKAYEGAKADAAAAVDDVERRRFRKVAAEELRHHKGFVARLEALGADPERAMRPYRVALDRYHGASAGGEVEEAIAGYLGEGIADDLLQWLRTVVDPETAAFIDTVIADEVEHEAGAAAALRGASGVDARWPPAGGARCTTHGRPHVVERARNGGGSAAGVRPARERAGPPAGDRWGPRPAHARHRARPPRPAGPGALRGRACPVERRGWW